MLFSSYEFLFLFLPLFLGLWWITGISARQYLPWLLLAASAFFYSLWGMGFFVLLLAMLTLNYCFGLLLAAMPDPGPTPDPAPALSTETSTKPVGTRPFWTRKKVLIAALLCNLAPLCYFKYSAFILTNISVLLDFPLQSPVTALPLGISFYTFIQIAWLMTVYRRQTQPEGFGKYALFSSCFPYVISGPIVRYGQMGPQFDQLEGLRASHAAPGLSLFVMGLAKKVLLADSLAVYANSIFSAAEKGFPLTGAEAWAGSLAYTFQLYFDFSGYTDMALGIALLLGIRLPDNFDSPYKATGIVDFWRRWHITLSAWLRDFLYIPLGGSRAGKLKQYRNLFLTMLLGGVWHGAGWPFVLWGAAHGAMLSLNHFFRSWTAGRVNPRLLHNPVSRLCSIVFTFLCINAAWVVFRADSISGAKRMYERMLQAFNEGGSLWANLSANHYIQDYQCPALLVLCALLVWGLPNSREILFGKNPARDGSGGGRAWLSWSPSLLWAMGTALLTLASLIMLSRKSVFLYFQF